MGVFGQHKLLRGRRGAIKTFLLDQDRIARFGNVYVQTPLWKAKIHPLRPIPSLSDNEIAALWQALHDILQGSIDAGGAPFEPNLYGQKGDGMIPTCSTGRKEHPVLPAGRPWPRSGRGARGVVSARVASTSSQQTGFAKMRRPK